MEPGVKAGTELGFDSMSIFAELSRFRRQPGEQQQQRIQRQHRVHGERRDEAAAGPTDLIIVDAAAAEVFHLRKGVGAEQPLPREAVPEAAGDTGAQGQGGGHAGAAEQEDLLCNPRSVGFLVKEKYRFPPNQLNSDIQIACHLSQIVIV